MPARQKLNQAFLTGSLLLASAVGWLTGSWLAFLVTAVVLVGLNLVGGDIRPDKRGR